MATILGLDRRDMVVDFNVHDDNKDTHDLVFWEPQTLEDEEGGAGGEGLKNAAIIIPCMPGRLHKAPTVTSKPSFLKSLTSLTKKSRSPSLVSQPIMTPAAANQPAAALVEELSKEHSLDDDEGETSGAAGASNTED